MTIAGFVLVWSWVCSGWPTAERWLTFSRSFEFAIALSVVAMLFAIPSHEDGWRALSWTFSYYFTPSGSGTDLALAIACLVATVWLIRQGHAADTGAPLTAAVCLALRPAAKVGEIASFPVASELYPLGAVETTALVALVGALTVGLCAAATRLAPASPPEPPERGGHGAGSYRR